MQRRASRQRQIVLDCRVHRIVNRRKHLDRRLRRVQRLKRRPGIIETHAILESRLPHQHLLMPPRIHQHIKRTNIVVLHSDVKIWQRIGRQQIEHHSQRVPRIQAAHQSCPAFRELRIDGLTRTCAELLPNFRSRVVRESEIRPREILVHHRHAQKLRDRVPFPSLSRSRENMSAAREYGSRHVSVNRLKKRQLPLNQPHVHHVPPQIQLMDRVDVFSIRPQPVQRLIQRPRIAPQILHRGFIRSRRLKTRRG